MGVQSYATPEINGLSKDLMGCVVEIIWSLNLYLHPKSILPVWPLKSIAALLCFSSFLFKILKLHEGNKTYMQTTPTDLIVCRCYCQSVNTLKSHLHAQSI